MFHPLSRVTTGTNATTTQIYARLKTPIRFVACSRNAIYMFILLQQHHTNHTTLRHSTLLLLHNDFERNLP